MRRDHRTCGEIKVVECLLQGIKDVNYTEELLTQLLGPYAACPGFNILASPIKVFQMELRDLGKPLSEK